MKQKKLDQVQPDHNLPYFPCYIADWLIDTYELTDEQDGAYFRLVRYQWKHGSIPDDKRILRKISDSFDDSWPFVSKYFVKNDEGRWYNKRADRERKKIISKINAGSKGGSKTPSKQPSKTPSETGIPQTSDLKPKNTEPKSQNLELKKSILREQTQNFDVFYKQYPRKVGKANALKSWLKLNPNQELFELILNALAKQIAVWDDPQFILHPTTWLNGRRWEDETVVMPGAKKKISVYKNEGESQFANIKAHKI